MKSQLKDVVEYMIKAELMPNLSIEWNITFVCISRFAVRVPEFIDNLYVRK